MKTYEAVFEPNKNKGVYGISLVENPAMEGNFIALSENKIEFKTVDEEKRILIGLVLEPNKPIYRNQDGEEFNIVFSEKTIEDLAHGFYKGGFQSNSSLEHNSKIKGVTFVESWIVLNEKNDKSNELGLNYPKGSWLATMKVDDDKIWNDYIKTGKVKGFSIDALVSLREVKLSKNQTTNGVDIWFKDAMITRGCEVTDLQGNHLSNGTHVLLTDVEIDIVNGVVTDIREVNFKSELNMSNQFLEALKELPAKIALALQPAKNIELGEMKSEDGKVSFMFEGDTMQVGGRIWVVAEDGTEVPLPVGDYVLEDGSILVVSEEGVIAEVKAKEAEQPMENKPAEMTSEQVSEATTAIENAIKSIMIKYSEDNQTVINELRTELAEMKEKVVSLSEQPASKPIVSAPVQVDLSKMSPKERLFNKINQVKN